MILKYNGSPISRTSELLNYLNRTQPNQSVKLEVLRDDKPRVITATLTVAPDDTPAKVDNTTTSAKPHKGPVIGVAIRALTEQEKNRLNVKGGVLIQDVTRGGLAAQSRILPGDVITQVNNKKINTPNDFVDAVAELQKNTVARVAIVREGQHAMIGLRIQ